MKNLHRVALSLSLTALATVAFSSAAGAAKTIKFWIPTDEQATWKAAVERFEKENRGVTVQCLTGNLDKFYTLIASGMMPDVWGPWDTPGLSADVTRNWALDLSPYLQRDGKSMNVGDFFPGLMRSFKLKGRTYSLPIFYYIDWFFYDPAKYAQAGLVPPPTNPNDKTWTWDKMVTNAKKTTKYTVQGAVSQPGLEFTRYLGNWATMWGAELYTKEAYQSMIPKKVDMDSPEMVNALTKAWELIYKYKVSTANPTYFSWNPGKVGASIEPGWNIKQILLQKKPSVALACLPYGKTNNGQTWPDGWRISRTTKDKELVWKFVKYLSSPDTMRFLIGHGNSKSQYKGSGVARRSVFTDTMAEDIARVTGQKAADIMRIYEGADDVGIIKDEDTICLHKDLQNQAMGPVLNDLWNNKYSPKEAAAKMQDRVDKMLPSLYNRWVKNVK